ncbi:MAG: YggT family protein [Gammaproteobacteria bacterium]|nr:YggT family protein [Gammaproteobacteria bacterium]
MNKALIFIIETFAQLYLLVLLLRFWLPILRADFHNPISQGILRLTSPMVVPLRRLLPAVGRIDTATVLIALAVQFAVLLLMLALMGQASYGVTDGLVPTLLTAVIKLVVLSNNLFFFAIFIKIILSWVAPHNVNPITTLLHTLSEPVLRPFRRIIPPIGGLDISPIFAIVLLQAVNIVLRDLRPLPL